MGRIAASLGLLVVIIPSAASADFVPDEWIVTRRASERWEAQNSRRWHFVAALDGSHALFRGAPGSSAAQRNYIYRTQEKGAFRSPDPAAGDPDLGKCWGLENTGQTPPSGAAGVPGADIGAPAAWPLAQGNNVVAAIIDSGVDTAHEEMQGQLWQNAGEIAGNNLDDDGNGFIDDVQGWNFVVGSNDVTDDNGHGTLGAGIIAARAENGKGARGVAAGARIMALKAVDKNGIITTARAIAAIDYAVRNGASLINASWGGTEKDQALHDAIAEAGRHGVLFIAAAGNDAKDNDSDPKPTYPASFALSNLIAVAAYDNRDHLASFSSYGKVSVALGAPGVGIFGPAPGGYRYADGTSFAAPYVTGVAALLKGLFPSSSPEAIRERLIATTAVLGYYEKEHSVSGGRLYAANAVRDIRPPRPELPSQWEVETAALQTEHPYQPRTSWRERIVRPGARHVRAHFKGFDTEACCDRVRLLDGDGREVARYAGRRGDFWSADALGDTLVVEFSSDASVQEYGFVIDATGAAD